MPHILIDAPIPASTVERLRALPGVSVTTVSARPEHSPAIDFPVELLRDVEIFVGNNPPRNHLELQSLKFVQLSSVGYAQLYKMELPKRGVRAANARGVYDTAIAEWNLGMMIALARDLRRMIRNQEHGVWEKIPRFANEIHGRVVGLWGYGGIGRETARLAKTLGMTIHAYARRGIQPRDGTFAAPGTGDPGGQLPDRVFTKGQEADFLRSVDFLILAMPLTPENRGLIGEAELRCLKPTAFVLNPARGALIEEAALLKALREGWFAGAALDTHYYYPMPADHPLWRFPNVIMTPHISGSDLGPHFANRMSDILLHNVHSYLTGQPLWNELTAEELTPNESSAH
ncbi:MAG: D-2-hydroxyacid dehydrogenase [Planctomycetaceae bacterium]